MSLLDNFLMAFETDGLKELPKEAKDAEKSLDDFGDSAEDAEKKVNKLDKSVLKDIENIKKLAIQASKTIAPFILLGKAIKETADFASDALEVAEAAEKAGMTLEQFQLQDGNKYAIFTHEDVVNAKEYEMVMRDIRMGTASIGAEVSKMILPALVTLLKIVRNVVDFFTDHGVFIKSMFIGMAIAITATAIPAIKSMTVALWGMLAPLLANPITWIIAGIVASIIWLSLVIEDLWKWIHGEPSLYELLFGDFETFKNEFINNWNNVVSFLKGVFNKIASFIEPLIGKIKELFAAFATGGLPGLVLRASVGMVKNAVNGSHANGLDYVPFDGYVAKLHKGERVQTAEEANSWRNGLMAAKSAVNFTSSFPLNSIPQGSISNAYNNANKTVNIGDITIQTQATDAQGIAVDLAQYIKQAVINLDDGMLA